ncbi:hypothetical protein AMS68_006994 [Peltaster fructicola]|uniref:Nitrogen permease regulator 3 n=1 Tax=Peltaster fructicola TaxID=286661 RepID=A0A6H0Y398_9PEZI|nr:hypothetical protein AMS68_006994 [Peltaster fructicola]
MNAEPSTNNLRAVLLCIRSRSGAKLVSEFPLAAAATTDVDPSASNHEVSTRSDGHEQMLGRLAAIKLDRDGQQSTSEAKKVASDTTLGIKTDVLEKLLTPGRWSEKQKFEVTIGDITFIGEPCHANEDGSWGQTHSKIQPDGQDAIERPHAIEIKEPPQDHQPRDFTHVVDSFDSGLNSQSLATSMESVSTRSVTVADGMLMFQVVFALHFSNEQSATLRSTTVYNDLCQPLTRALKYLQEKYRYVELESRKMLATKMKISAGTHENDAILHSSELAWALKVLYDASLIDEIANLTLHGIDMSLQVSVPDPTLPLQGPALRSALLLTEDKHSILRSLDAHPEAAAMSFFITHLVPTKPLSKMASRLSLPPTAVLLLAEHLIRWRKARLIAPLHMFTAKVLSFAEFAENAKHSRGGSPIVYGSCLPSRVHRDTYMDILAWLVCQRLVIRLNTQGWLRVALSDEQHTPVTLGTDVETTDDNSSTISDSGTAFYSDEKLRRIDRTVLILDPANTSPRERSVILEIRHSLPDVEMRNLFTRLLKYLNGEHAIEDIAIMEGLKRSKIDECINRLDKLGVLQTFQCPLTEASPSSVQSHTDTAMDVYNDMLA